jgi:hypothetical protein
MSLLTTIIVLVALAVILLTLLAWTMSWPRNLRPHRRRGGRPAARMRRYRGGR